MHIRSTIENAGKKVVKPALSLFYGYCDNKEVMRLAPTIQEYSSQKLTPKLKKIADEYSIDVFGSRRYSPWLYIYALVRGKFQEGWIPDNFYGEFVLPKINKELGMVSDFKSFSNVVLKTEALPDVAFYIDGIFYDKELSVANVDDLREKLSASNRAVFVKKDCSDRGTGVIKLAIDELNEDNLQRIGNCVIQSSIKQHEFFEEIISGSVATVRIITVKDKSGRIDLRAATLRLGRKDTAWVRSDNSVKVAIINRNGELDEFGYTQDWRRWSSHPDSGVSFKNRLIPKFKEAVELCIGLHNKVPHISIIGWDIAVSDKEQIEIMEWNAECGINFAEATTGPCFLGLDWEKYKKNPTFSNSTVTA